MQIATHKWQIAYRKKPEDWKSFNEWKGFCLIPKSSKYWVADPFIVEEQGRVFIFAELFDYVRHRGVIGYTEVTGKGATKWKPIIINKFHMSFPNIIKKEDGIYMIPETSRGNELMVYKAVHFPDKWEKYKTIKRDVEWVDTIFMPYNEGYVGFTQSKGKDDCNYKLTLDNDFNLIKREKLDENVNLYRNAGQTISVVEGYVRPCQDCEKNYGDAIILRTFDLGGDELFSKRVIPSDVTTEKLNRKFYGLHTFNSSENYQVVDLLGKKTLNIIDAIFKIIYKIKKIFKS